MFLRLTRKPANGKAVPGSIYIVNHDDDGNEVTLTHVCPTLENADFLIPPLIYRVRITHSPKFDKPLPILEQVPGRSGIRIHRGSRPEHSRGCILTLSDADQRKVMRLLTENNCNRYEVRIEIR